MNYELIIFDCDGVLVDSELLSNQIFCEILNGYGLNLTLDDMFKVFVGNSMSRCIEIIETMLGHPAHENIEATYQERTTIAFERDLKAVEGIEAILQKLHSPYCIASSGSHSKMQTTLGTTGLIKYFDNNIFSTKDVARPKPHPDVYLHAAEQMGHATSKCLVIEDSPLGVQAGKAAGMTVIGFTGSMPELRLKDAGADMTMSSMLEISDFLFS